MISARRGAKPAWCNGALRLHQQPSLRGNLAAALFGALVYHKYTGGRQGCGGERRSSSPPYFLPIYFGQCPLTLNPPLAFVTLREAERRSLIRLLWVEFHYVG